MSRRRIVRSRAEKDFPLEFKAYRHTHDSEETGIVHIVGESYATIAQALIRFQEHYESPHDHIRGQVFTLGQVRAAGRRTETTVNTYEGGENYDTDWSGYNFPGYVLKPFVQGLFDPLTDLEDDIVEAVKYNDLDNIYVIGTAGEDTTLSALDHEVCHALYYLNKKYQRDVNKALETVDLKNLKKMLVQWGYNKDQLLDECHAYLSADYDWLITKHADDMVKYDIDIDKKVHEKLRKVKKKYFDENWIKP